MGSCISRCSRKRKRQEESHPVVQDKLVITQAPISPLSLPSTKQLLSLAHSPTTTSSASTFSCTNTSTIASYSFTSSSSSSSSSISKDRSFSNDFLKTCVKENPHIIHTGKPVCTKFDAQKLENSVKSSFNSTPNKRARANSPNLTRQKSFRRENERPSSPYSLSRNALRSPSPTRRFTNTPKENYCKPSIVNKATVANSGSSTLKKQNLRPLSPRNNLTRNHGSFLMRRDQRCIYRIGSKIDEVKVGEVLSYKEDDDDDDDDVIPIEDIDNPLISLDCFIFL